MDTQLVNNQKKSSKVVEGLKKGAPILGGAAVAAGAFVAADVMAGDDDQLEVVDPEMQNIAEHQNQEEDQNANQPAAQSATHPEEHVTVVVPEEHGPQDNDPATTVQQPTTNDVAHQPVQETNHPVDPNDIPVINPDDVAQTIVSDEILVDPTDNDMENLAITSVGTIETADGQVLTAAQLTGDDGSDLYMVDVDGDNQYDLVADAQGNLVADVPTTLTVSDAENIADINNNETGYMASTDTDHTNIDDNPMEDIIDLG